MNMPNTSHEEYLEMQFNEVLDDNLFIAEPREIYYPFMNNWTVEEYLSFSITTTLKLLKILYKKKPETIKNECNFTSDSSLQRFTNGTGRISSLIRLMHYQTTLGLDSIHLLLPSHVSLIIEESPYIIRYTNDKALNGTVYKLKFKKYNYFVKLVYNIPNSEYNFFSKHFNENAIENTHTIFALIRKALSITDKTKFKKITIQDLLEYNNYQFLYNFENKNIGTLTTLLKLTNYYFGCGVDPITFYQAFTDIDSSKKLNLFVHDQTLFKKFENKTFQLNHIDNTYKIKIVLCPKSLT